jgi:hypothetical protein
MRRTSPDDCRGRGRFHGECRLTAFEGSFEQVDGKRQISQLITAATQSSWQSLPGAREFFRRMAEWDHLQFQIP